MNKQLLITILLGTISSSVIAETDFSAIEEQERAQIIKELSYRLETKQNCDQTLNWDDSGSGADLDGYFFIPNASGSEYIIGGHASGKRTSDYHCTTTVSEAAGNPKGTPPLLVKPADWKQVWKDSGSGAAKDGSFWHAIPPDNNYVCIGSISQLFHNTKPDLPNYRCVHKTLTDNIKINSIVWSDKGTGADQQVTVFSLPTTGAYIAVSPRASSTTAYDLKKNAASEPDPKMVEEILAKRIAPLKADIEAKTQAIREQREAAKKAEAEKAATAKATPKKVETKADPEKLAAAAEKKKQEEAAKLEALAAEAKAKQEKADAEAEQKLKEEQQARIAKAMAEKEAAKAEPVEEAKAEIEVPAAPELEEVVAEETISESTTSSETKSESKGLDDIMMFFLKVFGMMIGGVIVFMIAFKVLFGRKKES